MRSEELDALLLSGRGLVNAHEAMEAAIQSYFGTAPQKVSEIYSFYCKYSADKQMETLVCNKLEQAGRKIYERDTLYQRILRLIFKDNQRTTALRYSKAIQNAISEKVKVTEFVQWVELQGGINKAATLPHEKERKNYGKIAERNVFSVQKNARFEWPELSEQYEGRRALVLVDVDDNGSVSVLAADDNSDLIKKFSDSCGREFEQLSKETSNRRLDEMRNALERKENDF